MPTDWTLFQILDTLDANGMATLSNDHRIPRTVIEPHVADGTVLTRNH